MSNKLARTNQAKKDRSRKAQPISPPLTPQQQHDLELDRARVAGVQAGMALAAPPAAEAPSSSNGRVALEPKEQLKLNTLAARYVSAQQQLAQLQQAEKEAELTLREQNGRLLDRIESVLESRNLDPATHRWDFDGKTVTLRETREVAPPPEPAPTA